MGILDKLRSNVDRPIRRRLTVLVRKDPNTSQPSENAVSSQETILSKDGSIDTVKVTQVLDCMHTAESPLGGQCYECRALSCTSCHGQCHRCHRPVCPSCAHFEQTDVGLELRWCSHCYKPELRRRRWRRVGSLVAGPFVGQDREGGRRGE